MLQINPRSVFRRSTLSEYVVRPLHNKNVEVKLRPSNVKDLQDDEPYLIRSGSCLVFVVDAVVVVVVVVVVALMLLWAM